MPLSIELNCQSSFSHIASCVQFEHIILYIFVLGLVSLYSFLCHTMSCYKTPTVHEYEYEYGNLTRYAIKIEFEDSTLFLSYLKKKTFCWS